MPKYNAPASETAPDEEIDGRLITVPLLSAVNRETGFGTCAAVDTAVPVQLELLEQA
jgi:hypothetical protein